MKMNDNLQQCKAGLMDLPAELKNMIYRMLLTTRWNIKPCLNDPASVLTHYTLHPAILGVSRQIHAEAINVLKNDNTWIVATGEIGVWPQSLDREKFSAVSWSHAHGINNPALEIKLTLPSGQEPTPARTIVFVPESLDNFLMMYTEISHESTNIKFSVGNGWGENSHLKSACLDSFLAFNGLNGLEFRTQDPDAYTLSLTQKATTQHRTQEIFLKTLGTFSKECDEARLAKDLRQWRRAQGRYGWFLPFTIGKFPRPSPFPSVECNPILLWFRFRAALQADHIHLQLCCGLWRELKPSAYDLIEEYSSIGKLCPRVQLCLAFALACLSEFEEWADVVATALAGVPEGDCLKWEVEAMLSWFGDGFCFDPSMPRAIVARGIKSLRSIQKIMENRKYRSQGADDEVDEEEEEASEGGDEGAKSSEEEVDNEAQEVPEEDDDDDDDDDAVSYT